jgi:hypothetical protein
MKAKELKEIFNQMDDNEEFEFRLYVGEDYFRKIALPLEILNRGTQMTTPPTNYIGFRIPTSEVEKETTFPNVFYIDGRLSTITRKEYNNGMISYEEKSIDGIYKNEGGFY